MNPPPTNNAGQPGRVPASSWYVLGILVMVYILNFVDRQILSILANDIKRDLNLTDADLGFLYGTAFAVFYALFGIPLGRLADSWHRVRLLTIGLALWSLMTAASGFAKNGAQLTAARIGVGVGEATASPSAYSLISDLFPQRLRATALAIYSSGLYIGGGLSLLIGGAIVERWNAAYPGGGPLGLHGWHAAFVIVGLPGLLMALVVATIREPVRGAIDGLPSKTSDAPFKGFISELLDVIPPFTLIGAFLRGPAALARNVASAGVIAIAVYLLILAFGSATAKQWLFVGVGVYAVASWATALRGKDNATFSFIFGSSAFLCVVLGYGLGAFTSYSASYWAAPYAERTFGVEKSLLGWWIGGTGALAGFLGVIIGGSVADRLQARHPSGRLMVVMFGLIAPIPPLIWAYTTDQFAMFIVMNFLTGMLAATALGAAAAASQSLVLPHMRGTATATLFLSTTMIGLALGPFTAGYVSSNTGDNLALGVMSTALAAPLGVAFILAAFRLLPKAAASVEARAGEIRSSG